MPNIKGAFKRVKQAAAANTRNRAAKARISTIRRKLFAAFDGKDLDQSRKLFQDYCSVLDKSAKKGMIKKNTAVRRKHRASIHLAALAKPA